MRRFTLRVPVLAAAFVCHPPVAAQDADIERITRALSERLSGVEVAHVRPSPIAGIYEVSVEGSVVYVTGDTRYVFTGKLIDWQTGKDLSESALARVRLEMLARIPESKMIIYEPPSETRRTVTTFTDVDCPYCRKMHSEMAELNGYGIRVRYLLYPRTGKDSDSYRKAVSVWCAEDRQAALTRAKLGKDPAPRECPNPVAEHMALAERLGLSGTPMTITETGEQIMGYVPARELSELLNSAKTMP